MAEPMTALVSVRLPALMYFILLLILCFPASPAKARLTDSFTATQIWSYRSEPASDEQALLPGVGYSLWSVKSLAREESTVITARIQSLLPAAPGYETSCQGNKSPQQRLLLIWNSQTTETTSSPVSLPICFAGDSSGFFLQESSFRDAIAWTCQPAKSVDRQLYHCLISLQGEQQFAGLDVFNGQYDGPCTEQLWQAHLPPEKTLALALVQYTPGEPVVRVRHESRNNSTRLPSGGGSPVDLQTAAQLLGNGGSFPGDDSSTDHRRRPPFVITKADAITVILPGVLYDGDSLGDSSPETLDWYADPEQSGITIRFYLNGIEQSLTLSLEQWQILVEHQLHRSPALLQQLLVQLFQGQQNLEQLTAEIHSLLEQQNQIREQNASESARENTRSAIAMLLEELERIPPGQLTLSGGLQDWYERQLQQQLNWMPFEAERHAAGTESQYLKLLRRVLTRLIQGDNLQQTEGDNIRFDLNSPVNLFAAEALAERRLRHLVLTHLVSLASEVSTQDGQEENQSQPGNLPSILSLPRSGGQEEGPFPAAYSGERPEGDSGNAGTWQADNNSEHSGSKDDARKPPPIPDFQAEMFRESRYP